MAEYTLKGMNVVPAHKYKLNNVCNAGIMPLQPGGPVGSNIERDKETISIPAVVEDEDSFMEQFVA